ncbi:MAG: hypothetical protein IJM93_07110, partial [Oscillospiraceae bacterium]|nr:hypothetical protein [Oscillospiraceae bacterium]
VSTLFQGRAATARKSTISHQKGKDIVERRCLFSFSNGGFEPTMGATLSGSDGGATEKQSGGLF